MICILVRRSNLYLIGTVLMYIAMIMTGSRSGLLFGSFLLLVCLAYIYIKNKKHRRPVPKTCDPNLCDHCMYIGDGDFVCDLHGLGPEETVFVLEDWEPTENYLQCRRGGAAR